MSSHATDISLATRADRSAVLALLSECELLEIGVVEPIESLVVTFSTGAVIGAELS